MKKIYLSVLSGALVFAANSQVDKAQNGPVKRSTAPSELRSNVAAEIDNRVTIWSSDFETPSEWTMAHDPADCSLDWTIGTTGPAGAFPIAAMVTTGNFALLDSDLYGGAGGGTEVEDSWLTMSAGEDLTGFPNVVVEFETFYRRFNSERPYLVVGFGDGTGAASVTWPNLDPLTDITGMTNVFDVFPGWANSEASDNPLTAQVNISAALAGASATDLQNVYIRLNWTGTWGYAWMVDDLAIIEQPANDIQLTAAWFSGEFNYGMEYGNTPDSQVDANYYVGSTIFNFGVNDADSVGLVADFGVPFSFVNATPLLMSDSTVNLENLEAVTLPIGQYDGTYTTVSVLETASSPTFGNNTGLRSFAVTSDIYSLDGVDVYPASELDLTSMGSASFTGAEDGLVIAVEYNVKANMQVSGIRAMLVTTGSNPTVAGGDIYASIKDTSLFRTGDMTSSVASQAYTVTAADVANGYVDILFDQVETLTPNAYYAAVELYSNGNANDIRILDDRTVAQPGLASMIYIPGDASYTNGTASAVRLLVGDQWGASLNENILTGVSLFPNPSNGIVTISNDNNISGDVVVYDMVGKVIATTTLNGVTSLDLTENGVGVYMVKVSSADGSIVERVVIK